MASLMLTAAAPTAVAAPSLAGRWEYYPAAHFGNAYPQSQTAKITGGEDVVYVIMRGSMLDTSKKASDSTKVGYDHRNNYLFRYRPSAPAVGLEGLSPQQGLYNMEIEFTEYVPQARTLVVTYPDGAIDLVADDGTVTPVDTRGILDFPAGSSLITHINPDVDGKRVWLALTTGYACLDIPSGSITNHVNLGVEVASVARVGKKMAYVVVNKRRIFDASQKPTGYSDDYQLVVSPLGKAPETGVDVFQKVSFADAHSGGDFNASTGKINNPRIIVPLSETTFGVLSQLDGSHTALNVFTFDGDDVKGVSAVRPQVNFASMGANGNFRNTNDYDALTGVWREGIVINGQNGVALLRRGVDLDLTAADPAADYRSRALLNIAKNLPSDARPNEAFHRIHTWDGIAFWTANNADGLTLRMVTPGEGAPSVTAPTPAQWSAAEADIRFNAPLSGVVGDIAYLQNYGLTFRSTGSERFYPNTNSWDNIFSFDSNGWTNRSRWSQISGNPRFFGLNGLCEDPANPAWVWGSSYLHGLIRLNPADPADFAILGRGWAASNGRYDSTNGYDQSTGYLKVFDRDPVYAQLTHLSDPRFDADQTMWTVRNNLFNWDQTDYTDIFYWKRDDRLAVANATGADLQALYDAHPMQKIRLEGVSMWSDVDLDVMTHERNKGRMLLSPGYYVNAKKYPVIYDTNGTPDDTTDDRVARIDKIYDADTKEVIEPQSVYKFFEHHATGNAWLMTDLGVLVIDPDQALSGAPVEARPLAFAPDKTVDGISDLHGSTIIRMAYDNYGRVWLASKNNGLFCVSADGERLLGYYDTYNSGIPSNRLEGLGTDPVTGAVWIGSHKGLAAFYPEGSTSDAGAASDGVRVWPREVMPDYNGLVNFAGLSDNEEYVIADTNGVIVAWLDPSDNGMTQWRPFDDDGNALPTGYYSVVRSSDPTNPLREFRILQFNY